MKKNDKIETIMVNQGYLNTHEPIQREIWVQRKDDSLEIKIWFIYTYRFVGTSRDKILSFIDKEKSRYNWSNKISLLHFNEIAKEYSDLNTTNSNLPPRLWLFSENELDDIKTELFTNEYGFIFGDSVGGISSKKEIIHNEHLKYKINYQEQVLFSPGALARIIVEIGNTNYLIFQLAEKNLRKKEEVFYKPIGGHIKIKKDILEDLIAKYELFPKDRSENQDLNDLCVYIKPNYLNDFTNLFLNDIKSNTFQYFEDPEKSIVRELHEELGPIASSDGINLLSSEDLNEIKND